jgi:hypothetical protein
MHAHTYTNININIYYIYIIRIQILFGIHIYIYIYYNKIFAILVDDRYRDVAIDADIYARIYTYIYSILIIAIAMHMCPHIYITIIYIVYRYIYILSDHSQSFMHGSIDTCPYSKSTENLEFSQNFDQFIRSLGRKHHQRLTETCTKNHRRAVFQVSAATKYSLNTPCRTAPISTALASQSS